MLVNCCCAAVGGVIVAGRHCFCYHCVALPLCLCPLPRSCLFGFHSHLFGLVHARLCSFKLLLSPVSNIRLFYIRWITHLLLHSWKFGLTLYYFGTPTRVRTQLSKYNYWPSYAYGLILCLCTLTLHMLTYLWSSFLTQTLMLWSVITYPSCSHCFPWTTVYFATDNFTWHSEFWHPGSSSKSLSIPNCRTSMYFH